MSSQSETLRCKHFQIRALLDHSASVAAAVVISGAAPVATIDTAGVTFEVSVRSLAPLYTTVHISSSSSSSGRESTPIAPEGLRHILSFTVQAPPPTADATAAAEGSDVPTVSRDFSLCAAANGALVVTVTGVGCDAAVPIATDCGSTASVVLASGPET